MSGSVPATGWATTPPTGTVAASRHMNPYRCALEVYSAERRNLSHETLHDGIEPVIGMPCFTGI